MHNNFDTTTTSSSHHYNRWQGIRLFWLIFSHLLLSNHGVVEGLRPYIVAVYSVV